MTAAEQLYTGPEIGELSPEIAGRLNARPYRMDVHHDVATALEPTLGIFGLAQAAEPDQGTDAEFAMQQAVNDLAHSFVADDPATSMLYALGRMNEVAAARGQRLEAVITKVFEDAEGTKMAIASAGSAYAYLYPRTINNQEPGHSFVGNFISGDNIGSAGLDGTDEAIDEHAEVRIINLQPGDRIGLLSESLFYNAEGGHSISSTQHRSASPTSTADLDEAGAALLHGTAGPRDRVAVLWEILDEGGRGEVKYRPFTVRPLQPAGQEQPAETEVVEAEVIPSSDSGNAYGTAPGRESPVIEAEIVEEQPARAGNFGGYANPDLSAPVRTLPEPSPRTIIVPTMSRPYADSPGSRPEPGWRRFYRRQRIPQPGQRTREKGRFAAGAAAIGAAAVAMAGGAKRWMTVWKDPRRRAESVRYQTLERSLKGYFGTWHRLGALATVGLASFAPSRVEYRKKHINDPVYRDRNIWIKDQMIRDDMDRRHARRNALVIGGLALAALTGAALWYYLTKNPAHHHIGNAPAPRPPSDLPSQTTNPGGSVRGGAGGNTPPTPVWHPLVQEVTTNDLYSSTLEGNFHDIGHHLFGFDHYTGNGAHAAFEQFRQWAHEHGYGDNFVLINGKPGTYEMKGGGVGLIGPGHMQFVNREVEDKALEFIRANAS